MKNSIILSLPYDVYTKIEEQYQGTEKQEVIKILENLFDRLKNYGVIVQAIRGILFIAEGQVGIVKDYCLPTLKYDPRDIVMEAEELAGRPGHWFGIPFDQMETFSGKHHPSEEIADDGLSF